MYNDRLHGAYARTDRASKHLADLKERTNAFLQMIRDDITIERKPETFLLPDGRQVMDGTQFPIEDAEKGFIDKRNSYLKGISDNHVTAIKRLQPCDGCDWTKVLRNISNPDKHRHLIAVGNPVIISLSPGSTEAILAGHSVDVKNDISSQIAFSDGLPTVEILEQLVSQLSQTLDAFKSEFQ